MIEDKPEDNNAVPPVETRNELKAGPEFDALIDERIFGIRRVVSGGFAPCYSSDIAASWRVVEQLRRLGFDVRLEGKSGYNWSCVAWLMGVEYEQAYLYFGDEATAPLAICRAALKAVVERGDDAGD